MLTPPGPSLMAVAVSPHSTRYAGLTSDDTLRAHTHSPIHHILYESFHSRHLFISLAISL